METANLFSFRAGGRGSGGGKQEGGEQQVPRAAAASPPGPGGHEARLMRPGGPRAGTTQM